MVHTVDHLCQCFHPFQKVPQDQRKVKTLVISVYFMDFETCYFPFNSICSIQQRRQWHPTPVLLPRKSHGQRSLVGCSPWGHQESDTTERLHFHFSLSCIGEGNGNPLQCSCPENPRDRGAWLAAVCGVAQSQTRLKQLSSSSSSSSIQSLRSHWRNFDEYGEKRV